MIPAIHVPELALQEAHAQGLLNQQLADHFGVGLATIKRRLKGLGLASNHIPNQTGEQGERLVAAALHSLGHQVETMPKGSPYDLLVDGLRVDVKATATVSPQGTYTFRLPATRPSFHNRYRYPKNYARDSDFIVLAALKGGALLHVYVLPVALWEPRITVRPASPFDPLAAHRNAWGLLAPHPAAARPAA